MESKEGDPIRENVGSCNDCPLRQVLPFDDLSLARQNPCAVLLVQVKCLVGLLLLIDAISILGLEVANFQVSCFWSRFSLFICSIEGSPMNMLHSPFLM